MFELPNLRVLWFHTDCHPLEYDFWCHALLWKLWLSLLVAWQGIVMWISHHPIVVYYWVGCSGWDRLYKPVCSIWIQGIGVIIGHCCGGRGTVARTLTTVLIRGETCRLVVAFNSTVVAYHVVCRAIFSGHRFACRVGRFPSTFAWGGTFPRVIGISFSCISVSLFLVLTSDHSHK